MMVSVENQDLISKIADYWDHHIHDLSIARYPVGTREFFQELDDYRYEKLNYLPRVVNFSDFRGKALLEIGCGVGIDLVRFAQGGAIVAGVDLSETAIGLAGVNMANHGLNADLRLMNGESLDFLDNCFDVVYAHGVIQYTADPKKMVEEIYRVLKPGGQAILMVYNRYSWLNLVRRITKVPLEHEDAPVLRKFSISEFKQLIAPFQSYRIIPERFPVKTRLHSGWKARVFNDVFVTGFNLMPKALVAPTGWHLMAFAEK